MNFDTVADSVSHHRTAQTHLHRQQQQSVTPQLSGRMAEGGEISSSQSNISEDFSYMSMSNSFNRGEKSKYAKGLPPEPGIELNLTRNLDTIYESYPSIYLYLTNWRLQIEKDASIRPIRTKAAADAAKYQISTLRSHLRQLDTVPPDLLSTREEKGLEDMILDTQLHFQSVLLEKIETLKSLRESFDIALNNAKNAMMRYANMMN